MHVSNELLFRIIFSTLWIIVFADVGWVGYSAKDSGSRWMTRRSGRLRITALCFAAIYFAGALLYALLPSSVISFSLPLPDWFRFVMVGVAVLGILFLSWGYWALGRNWAPSVSGVRSDTVLVTTGLYGFVRHPVYLGISIFMGAMALVTANLIIVLPTMALLVLLYVSIDEEEAVLVERFGGGYREYMKCTPRFIPRFKHEHPRRREVSK
jgi:protein-S-isoprenylcysteine O-methyltransferase Ste14